MLLEVSLTLALAIYLAVGERLDPRASDSKSGLKAVAGFAFFDG